MKGTIAAPMFLLAISCVAQTQTETPPAQSYLETAMKWPTYFGVSSSELADVWSRARAWAEDYGGGSLIVDTDDEIVTIRSPNRSHGALTLRITRTETFGGSRITVVVIPHRTRVAEEADEAERIAHLVAYHLASGRSIPEQLVSR
ncbi:MAG TPA: hypothetical protein VNA88_07030 [Candidatus Kapabacteria bacterium]|jgi:hypothetical protein|nr:hypothetical protein [Candidatus Kapabacteria bacterium]